MTAAQQQALDRARTRIARLQPDVIAAFLATFEIITRAISESELARLIATGAIDHIVHAILTDALLTRATMPVRLALRETVEKAFKWNVPYLPAGGKVNGTVAVVFDHLNPRVIDALSSFENAVIANLKDDVRATVRQAIARGLEEQRSAVAIARDVKSVIGLSPRGEAAAANFRAMLEAGDREALTRELRDRRFDATLERALGADGTGLTPTQVETMSKGYRNSIAASEAENVSRAATHSAYKLAQKESWASAIERGIVPDGIVTKRWLHLDAQPNPRPLHAAMQGETVPIDANYSNGDSFAGESDPWGCKCLDIYGVSSAA